MNIDMLGGMPPPQTIDIKVEKNSEREDSRPIEESGKSNDLKLNVDKKAISEKQVAKNSLKKVEVDPDTYNGKGDLSQAKISENETDNQQEPIHLVV